MKKACIFDFDGVIVDNERFWEIHKKLMFKELYGDDIANKLDKTLGANMDAIHAMATALGSTVPVEKLYTLCDIHAESVYTEAPITPGLEAALETLQLFDFALAIVSASPRAWIDIALRRLHTPITFDPILSLHDRLDIAHKPDPAGYKEAIKMLGVEVNNTIVIEDSNSGLRSAIDSGAYTVCLRQNHISGYHVTSEPDISIDHISQLHDIAKSFRA